MTPGDARAEALLEPIRDLVSRALSACGLPMPTVGFARQEAHWRWEDGHVCLNDELLGPSLHASFERSDLPLDRWRRAAGSIVEGALSQAARIDENAPRWARHGLLVYQADAVAPELQLAAPDLLSAWATGDLERHPRAGVAVMRVWAARGVDPAARAARFSVDEDEWHDLCAAMLDTRGPVRDRVVPVDRIASADIPLSLEPWSFRPLCVPAHPRGGEIVVEGSGRASPRFARSRRDHRALATTTRGARFSPGPGFPVGRWGFRTAAGFGQVFGSRGMTYVFDSSGRLTIELADAFVGPLAALEQAERMGTSGVVPGTWEIAGDQQVQLDRIDPKHIATHGRRVHEPVLPSEAFGMGPILRALTEAPWRWSAEGDRLTLQGQVFGGPVELRFQRE